MALPQIVTTPNLPDPELLPDELRPAVAAYTSHAASYRGLRAEGERLVGSDVVREAQDADTLELQAALANGDPIGPGVGTRHDRDRLERVVEIATQLEAITPTVVASRWGVFEGLRGAGDHLADKATRHADHLAAQARHAVEKQAATLDKLADTIDAQLLESHNDYEAALSVQAWAERNGRPATDRPNAIEWVGYTTPTPAGTHPVAAQLRRLAQQLRDDLERHARTTNDNPNPGASVVTGFPRADARARANLARAASAS